MSLRIFFISLIIVLSLILLLASNNIQGSLSIFLVSFLIIRFQQNFSKSLNLILSAALLLRLIIIVIGEFITLPDSDGDSMSFYIEASNLSESNLSTILKSYPGPHSSFFPWIFGMFFWFFGNNLLMAKSINLLFSIGTIYFCWLTIKKIYNEKLANRSCWILVFFPSFALYSTLFLREVYVYFFLSLALYGMAEWVKNNNYKYLIVTFICFIAGGFFHGLMFIGLIFFSLFYMIYLIKKFFTKLLLLRINIVQVILLVLLFTFFAFFISDKIGFPKIGKFSSLVNQEIKIKQVNKANRGEASFPEWTKFNSPSELIYKLPLKSIYFLVTPFPFGVKSAKHLIGFFDGFLFSVFIILIIKNLKIIFTNKTQLIFLLLLIIFTISTSYGVGNFGTGIRHRAKLLVLFVIVIAPFVPRIFISKK